MKQRTRLFFLLWYLSRTLRHLVIDSCSFAKQFGSVSKELYSAEEEFGLAKLLSQ
ncbi:hypothetical protein [Candidatus Electronema sp. PJ]|uniref:hypothetical protein n=1 Tax=Candidatus Electronema sp. PJ TaxID=3401572 RepID=UPI003AA8BE56